MRRLRSATVPSESGRTTVVVVAVWRTGGRSIWGGTNSAGVETQVKLRPVNSSSVPHAGPVPHSGRGSGIGGTDSPMGYIALR